MGVTRWTVEVEPLNDARWARVERQIFVELDAGDALQTAHAAHATVAGEAAPREQASMRARFARAAAGLAIAAAVAMAVVFGHRALTRPGEGQAVVAPRLEDRSTLATTDSTSQFTVGESSLTVAPRSLVMVSGDDAEGIDVVLDRGQVTCEVAPRKGRPPFRLEAGEVHVRVTGTKFTVTRDGGATTVDVERGSVEVTSRGVVSQVAEGGHWPAEVSPAMQGGPGSALPAVSAAASEQPAPARRRAHLRGKVRHRAHGEEASTPAEPAEEEPAEPAPSAPAAAPSASAPSASQQAFEAAAKIERTNPDAAAAAYGELANGSTAWAPNALFALARLEADRGHRAEAVRLFDAYLGRYPHGINADDAREMLRHIR